MLIEIWLTPNGRYEFFSYYPPMTGYFVLKNGEFEGLFDSLDDCKEYTVDYDRKYGDSTFDIPE